MKDLTVAKSYSSEDAWFYESSEEFQRKYLAMHPYSRFSKNSAVREKAEQTRKQLNKLPAEESVENLKKATKAFTKEQKDFFRKNQHKPNSDDRRNAADLLKDKASGIVKALKHEKKEWKLAANALRKLKAGEALDAHDKSALKSVGTHLGIVAGEIVLTGGLSHGVAIALPHLAKGLVAHSLAVSGAKSALFASVTKETDEELIHELVQKFIVGVQSAPIEKKDWIAAVAKHNATKGKKNA